MVHDDVRHRARRTTPAGAGDAFGVSPALRGRVRTAARSPEGAGRRVVGTGRGVLRYAPQPGLDHGTAGCPYRASSRRADDAAAADGADGAQRLWTVGRYGRTPDQRRGDDQRLLRYRLLARR